MRIEIRSALLSLPGVDGHASIGAIAHHASICEVNIRQAAGRRVTVTVNLSGMPQAGNGGTLPGWGWQVEAN